VGAHSASGRGLQCTGFRNWSRAGPLMKSRHSRELVRATTSCPHHRCLEKTGMCSSSSKLAEQLTPPTPLVAASGHHHLPTPSACAVHPAPPTSSQLPFLFQLGGPQLFNEAHFLSRLIKCARSSWCVVDLRRCFFHAAAGSAETIASAFS
jgi:hypothetical protein